MCLERREKEDFHFVTGTGVGAEFGSQNGVTSQRRRQLRQTLKNRRLSKGTGREEGHFGQEEQHELLQRRVKFHRVLKQETG